MSHIPAVLHFLHERYRSHCFGTLQTGRYHTQFFANSGLFDYDKDSFGLRLCLARSEPRYEGKRRISLNPRSCSERNISPGRHLGTSSISLFAHIPS